MRQCRNFIENNCNVCKQKVKKGWEEGVVIPCNYCLCGWEDRVVSKYCLYQWQPVKWY